MQSRLQHRVTALHPATYATRRPLRHRQRQMKVRAMMLTPHGIRRAENNCDLQLWQGLRTHLSDTVHRRRLPGPRVRLCWWLAGGKHVVFSLTVLHRVICDIWQR